MELKPLNQYTASELSNPDYHAAEGLSSTQVKNLTNLAGGAILDYQKAHPREESFFEFGTAAHALVLEGIEPAVWPEPGTVFTSVDGKEYKMTAGHGTKAAEAWKNTLPEHTPVLSETQVTQLREMADMTWVDTTAREFLHDGEGVCESSFFAVDNQTGTVVKCRPDRLLLRENETIIVDYKTTSKTFHAATVEEIQRQAEWAFNDYKYAIQAAWYLDIITAHGYPNPRFVFIFQSKTGPFFTCPYEPSVYELATARQLIDTAISNHAVEHLLGPVKALNIPTRRELY